MKQIYPLLFFFGITLVVLGIVVILIFNPFSTDNNFKLIKITSWSLSISDVAGIASLLVSVVALLLSWKAYNDANSSEVRQMKLWTKNNSSLDTTVNKLGSVISLSTDLLSSFKEVQYLTDTNVKQMQSNLQYTGEMLALQKRQVEEMERVLNAKPDLKLSIAASFRNYEQSKRWFGASDEKLPYIEEPFKEQIRLPAFHPSGLPRNQVPPDKYPAHNEMFIVLRVQNMGDKEAIRPRISMMLTPGTASHQLASLTCDEPEVKVNGTMPLIPSNDMPSYKKTGMSSYFHFKYLSQKYIHINLSVKIFSENASPKEENIEIYPDTY